MVDLQQCSKITNMVLGTLTVLIGLITFVFLIFKVRFDITILPLYVLPFFLALAGFLVLFNERDIDWIKQNCQFLSHKVGKIIFYVYLAAVMGQLSSMFKAFGGLAQVCAIGAAIGYMVLAVLFGLVGCFGMQKVNEKANNIQDKITAD